MADSSGRTPDRVSPDDHRAGRIPKRSADAGWTVCRGLKETRPTSIDVLLSGPQKRIAIECKFTEQEFGAGSRPQEEGD